MYSLAHCSTSTVTNDVTALEDLLSEVHCNTEINHSWANDLHPQPIHYQSQQWIQETQAIRNIHEYPEELVPVFQNFTANIPAPDTQRPALSSDGYEQSNCFANCQMYASNQSSHIAIQEQSYLQTLSYNRIHHGNFGVSQEKRTSLKSIGKRKRKRTMFTTEQVQVLEKVYLSKPYISRDERQALVEELQIKDKIIKVWFQNRRLKEKREAEEAAQEIYNEDAETNETQNKFDELSYVESRLHQTDKFGYVTLDDRAVNGLVTVIDNILSQEAVLNITKENEDDNILPEKLQESVVTPVISDSDSIPIYEPISPATSDCNSSEESTSYDTFEPKESLQRIFDIQEFLVFHKK